MRRFAAAVLVICLFAMLFSCTGKGGEPKDSQTENAVFQAVVTDVTETVMLIRPVEGSDELRSSDSFSIGLDEISDGTVPTVGDVYRIEYSGEILEIYPAALVRIESVVLVSSASGS